MSLGVVTGFEFEDMVENYELLLARSLRQQRRVRQTIYIQAYNVQFSHCSSFIVH